MTAALALTAACSPPLAGSALGQPAPALAETLSPGVAADGSSPTGISAGGEFRPHQVEEADLNGSELPGESFPLTLLQVGELLRAGGAQLALTLCDQALSRGGAPLVAARWLTLKSHALMALEHHQEAARLLQGLSPRLVAADPELTLMLGEALLESGDAPTARRVFGQFLLDFPDHPKRSAAQRGVGLAALESGALEEAELHLGFYRQEAEIPADDPELTLAMARLAERRGDLGGAIARLEPLVAHDPTQPLARRALWRLIDLWGTRGQLDQVEKGWRRLLATPGLPPGERWRAGLALADWLAARERFSEAILQLEALLAGDNSGTHRAASAARLGEWYRLWLAHPQSPPPEVARWLGGETPPPAARDDTPPATKRTDKKTPQSAPPPPPSPQQLALWQRRQWLEAIRPPQTESGANAPLPEVAGSGPAAPLEADGLPPLPPGWEAGPQGERRTPRENALDQLLTLVEGPQPWGLLPAGPFTPSGVGLAPDALTPWERWRFAEAFRRAGRTRAAEALLTGVTRPEAEGTRLLLAVTAGAQSPDPDTSTSPAPPLLQALEARLTAIRTTPAEQWPPFLVGALSHTLFQLQARGELAGRERLAGFLSRVRQRVPALDRALRVADALSLAESPTGRAEGLALLLTLAYEERTLPVALRAMDAYLPERPGAAVVRLLAAGGDTAGAAAVAARLGLPSASSAPQQNGHEERSRCQFQGNPMGLRPVTSGVGPSP